jgi:hypothetical protein
MDTALDAAVVDGPALAEELRTRGHDVRLSTLGAPPFRLGRLLVSGAQLAWSMGRLALAEPAPDVVLILGPPHLPALLAEMVATARGISGAVVLTALSTEARLRTGEIRGGTLEASLRLAVETALLRRARALVVPSEALRRRVLLKGARPGGLRVAPGLLVPVAPAPTPGHVRRLRSDLAQGAGFLAVVPAALGAATDLGTLMDALTLLRHEPTLALAAVGGGSRSRALADMVVQRGLRNVVVRPLTREDRRAAVHAADVLVGISVPAHDGLCLPRALARSLWAGRPLVAVGPTGSDLVRETRRLGLGPCVDTGDAEGLAREILRLSRDRDAVEAYARRARVEGDQVPSPLPLLVEAARASGDGASRGRGHGQT